MEGGRRKGRELALQMLYQWEVTRQGLEEVCASMTELETTPEPAASFSKELVVGTLERLQQIDALLEEHSEHWRLSRMSSIDRNVLRLAVYELIATDTPKGVVINEAIEVVKRFSGPESRQFVNGILDAVGAKLVVEGDRDEKPIET